MAFLTVQYIGKENTLYDVSFTQQAFEKIAISGETGSGKSTLLKIIAGFIQPDEGAVFIDGERVKGPNEKLLPGHKHIAYLSQYFELRNNYRVEEELEYTNELTEEEAMSIFKICHIAHLLKRRTDQLSGGEKQRISLARLLIAKPKLLLLDEPFSNLDMMHKHIIKSVIHAISEQLAISCILVSHDAADVLSWADTIMVIKDGKILQTGTPKQVYRQPINEYCAGLFGLYSLIPPDKAKHLLDSSNSKTLGHSTIIRPEQFSIVPEAQNAISGTIEKVLFYGSYMILDVMAQDLLLHIYSTSHNYKVGDTIFVAINADRF
jgi:ABC-type sugar transport system ATPase subunit